MGIISKAFNFRDKISGVNDPAPWLQRLFSGSPSRTGVDVNNYSAMHLTAFYACIRIISETIASLPLKVYRKNAQGGKEEAPNHALYSVLHDKPNEEMTAMTFREMLQAHVLTWGNGYAYILRDNANRVKGLYPLLPNKTWSERRKGTNEIIYWTSLPDGQFRWMPKRDVFHLHGLGFDGMTGYSPVHMAREAIGLGLAAEEFGARFYGQGTHLGGFVSYPESLSDEAYQRLKESMNDQYQGLGKSHLLLLLEEGGSFERMGIPPNEAQFLETRKYQVQEIARIFRVPVHMLGDLERATHTNIEHQALEFVTQTLRPWLVRWEQEIKFKLVADKNYFAEHVAEGLLRGDIQARYNAYAVGRQNGWLNADEIRELENMNPMPEGKGEIYWQPLNVVEAGTEVVQDNNDVDLDDDDDDDEDNDGNNRSAQYRIEQAKMNERSAQTRDRLIRRHQRSFEDAFTRILRREKADIERKAKRELGNRSLRNFQEWLEDYYDEAPSWMYRTLLPAVMTFGETIQEEAAKEIGAAVGLSSAMEKYLREYTQGTAEYYAISSKNQMSRLVTETIDKGEDPLLAVQERLGSWEETRPQKESTAVTRGEANAISERAWKESGVTRKVWHAIGAETCPYCKEMDGVTVDIDAEFVRPEEEFQPEGAERPIKRKKGIKHPPLHRGCQCVLLPG